MPAWPPPSPSPQPRTDPSLTESEKAILNTEEQALIRNEARLLASLPHANIMPIHSMVYEEQPSGERSLLGFSMPAVDSSLADCLHSLQ